MSAPSLSIKLRSILQMAPYLARCGVSPLEFFQRLGISPNIFQDPETWLPRAQCFQVANEMAAVTSPFGGAYVGHLTEIRSLGQWGDLVLRSANVAQACIVASANAAMLHQGGEIRIVTEGRTTRLIHRFNGQHEADPRQFVFGSLAVLRKIPLMAGEPDAIRVHLRASSSRGTEVLDECLGTKLEMGSEYDMIEFDRDLLDMPLQHQADDAWSTTAALHSTTQTAGLLLRHLSESSRVTLPSVAAAIGLSPRTLQRRLKHCGVEFEALRDDTRRVEALRLLAARHYSATDIAYMVGYSDPAHFTRAFKRWTGELPSRFLPRQD